MLNVEEITVESEYEHNCSYEQLRKTAVRHFNKFHPNAVVNSVIESTMSVERFSPPGMYPDIYTANILKIVVYFTENEEEEEDNNV